MKTPAKEAKPKPMPTIGFGVPATTDPHHFIVNIPKDNRGVVIISENLGIQAQDQATAIISRVRLERVRWTAIRSEVQRAFNNRLKERHLKVSSWTVGDNRVDRLLGKELCVLAWAVETLKLENIPIAVRNWLALRPEERWWLFGMVAMNTGGVFDSERGWRLALRHALGDIAQHDTLKPQISKSKKSVSGDESEPSMFSLFDELINNG